MSPLNLILILSVFFIFSIHPSVSKLLGLGMALLETVDPNPENFVCAGVIQTKAQQVGSLLRLEPNAQAQV